MDTSVDIVAMPDWHLPAHLLHIGEVVPTLQTHRPVPTARAVNHWELILVQRGSQRVALPDDVVTMTAGQALVIPPQVERQTSVVLDGSSMVLVCSWQGWSPVATALQLDDTLGRMLRACRQLLDLAAEQTVERDCLLMLLLQAVADELQGDQEVDRSMAWLRRFIERNHAGPLDQDFLADHIGLSVRQISRRFQAAYGCTPSRYLREVRVERAATLVAAGMSLTEAVTQVGFSSARYLGRLLHQRAH